MKVVWGRVRPLITWKNLFFLVILLAGVSLALAVRIQLLGFVSTDYRIFNSIWYRTVQQQGFAAFTQPFSNYTPFYLYLLLLVSRLFPHLPALIAVKLPALACDFLAAFIAYRIVRLWSPSRFTALAAALLVLFAPTVILNSAAWGQTDMIYTVFLLGCVYFLARKLPYWSMLCFALAFAMKLQAIFLAPFLGVALLKQRMPWPSLLLVPLVYLLVILPAWIAGRPLLDLLTIYLDQGQANYRNLLSLNMPNLYAWLPAGHYDLFVILGLAFALVIVASYVAAGYFSRRELDARLLLELALVSAYLLPFVLPKMHDRYFFPADVLSILYAFAFPRRFYVPIGVSLVSLLAYGPFLFHTNFLPMTVISVIALGVLAILVFWMALDLYLYTSKAGQAIHKFWISI